MKMSLDDNILVSTKRRASTSSDVKCHFLYRHECFSGDYITYKIHTKIHPNGAFFIINQVCLYIIKRKLYSCLKL